MSLTTDRNDPGLGVTKDDGQQVSYLVLSNEEMAKGFVRPVRQTYIHKKCGGATKMARNIAETYATNPAFYGATFCCNCGTHFPLQTSEGPQFLWEDGTVVGS